MAKVIPDLDSAISYINFIYNASSSPPTSGDEDYLVWTGLINLSVNVWESEEGILWNELFVKLADASDGDKTTNGSNSYDCPTLFSFPACGYVWLGTGTNKTAYKVIKQEEKQLYENDSSNWCYFLMDSTPTLEFNPNLIITSGQTINYEYYKKATKLSAGADTFEMSDPMFAVYYALSELKKEEGNQSEVAMATQKLDAMKTKNIMPSFFQEDSLNKNLNSGFNT
jgi:hypothetical protein